ncbi:MAG: DUF4416 family protein [bacterium]|nr:DUF4416 family protein [bacterium]
MGVEQGFKKVKLFSGVIYRDEHIYPGIKEKLEGFFSSVDLETGPIDFNFTTYYNREMGTPLFRRFISFEKLIDPQELPDSKLLTNKLEIETTLEGNRAVNLDPGYLSDANVIIATTKNHYHRVPLTKGIYAHIEYMRIGKKLVTMEWTYPDFKSPQYMVFFEQLIPLYRQGLKKIL